MQIAGKNFNVITMTVNKDYYVKSQNFDSSPTYQKDDADHIFHFSTGKLFQ